MFYCIAEKIIHQDSREIGIHEYLEICVQAVSQGCIVLFEDLVEVCNLFFNQIFYTDVFFSVQIDCCQFL